jgi:hypothetical protein
METDRPKVDIFVGQGWKCESSITTIQGYPGYTLICCGTEDSKSGGIGFILNPYMSHVWNNTPNKLRIIGSQGRMASIRLNFSSNITNTLPQNHNSTIQLTNIYLHGTANIRKHKEQLDAIEELHHEAEQLEGMLEILLGDCNSSPGKALDAQFGVVDPVVGKYGFKYWDELEEEYNFDRDQRAGTMLRDCCSTCEYILANTFYPATGHTHGGTFRQVFKKSTNDQNQTTKHRRFYQQSFVLLPIDQRFKLLFARVISSARNERSPTAGKSDHEGFLSMVIKIPTQLRRKWSKEERRKNKTKNHSSSKDYIDTTLLGDPGLEQDPDKQSLMELIQQLLAENVAEQIQKYVETKDNPLHTNLNQTNSTNSLTGISNSTSSTSTSPPPSNTFDTTMDIINKLESIAVTHITTSKVPFSHWTDLCRDELENINDQIWEAEHIYHFHRSSKASHTSTKEAKHNYWKLKKEKKHLLAHTLKTWAGNVLKTIKSPLTDTKTKFEAVKCLSSTSKPGKTIKQKLQFGNNDEESKAITSSFLTTMKEGPSNPGTDINRLKSLIDDGKVRQHTLIDSNKLGDDPTPEQWSTTIQHLSTGKASEGPNIAILKFLLQNLDLSEMLRQMVINEKNGATLGITVEKDGQSLIKKINIRKRRMVAIPKQGKPQDTPAGWRWLSIMHAIQKITETWFQKGMDPFMRERIPITQGCGPGRNCMGIRFLIDRIHRIRRAMGHTTFTAYIDQIKAFDVVDREILYLCLRLFGLGDKAMAWIKYFFRDASIFTMMPDGSIVTALENKGIPQGSPLSPNFYVIFDYISEQVYRTLLPDSVRQMNIYSIPDAIVEHPRTPADSLSTALSTTNLEVSNLQYMDDGTRIADDNSDYRTQLQLILQTNYDSANIMSSSMHIGTAFNTKGKSNSKTVIGVTLPVGKKSTSMDLSPIHLKEISTPDGHKVTPHIPFTIKPQKVLGIYAQEDGTHDTDIRFKTFRARNTHRKYAKNFFHDNRVSPQMKFEFFIPLVMSAALYGSEVWSYKSMAYLGLRKFYRKCIRGICNTNQYRMKSSHTKQLQLHAKYHLPSLRQLVDGRLFQFIGTLVRKRHQDIGSIALNAFIPIDQSVAHKNGIIDSFGDSTQNTSSHPYKKVTDEWAIRVTHLMQAVRRAIQREDQQEYKRITGGYDDIPLVTEIIQKQDLLNMFDYKFSARDRGSNGGLCDCFHSISDSLSELVQKQSRQEDAWPSDHREQHMSLASYSFRHDFSLLPPGKHYNFSTRRIYPETSNAQSPARARVWSPTTQYTYVKGGASRSFATRYDAWVHFYTNHSLDPSSIPTPSLSTSSSSDSNSTSTSPTNTKSQHKNRNMRWSCPECHARSQWHDSVAAMKRTWRYVAESRSLWREIWRLTFKGYNGEWER